MERWLTTAKRGPAKGGGWSNPEEDPYGWHRTRLPMGVRLGRKIRILNLKWKRARVVEWAALEMR